VEIENLRHLFIWTPWQLPISDIYVLEARGIFVFQIFFPKFWKTNIPLLPK